MFTQMTSSQNLYLAFAKAKNLKGQRPDIMEFEYYLENNLADLKRELEEETYCCGTYKTFIVKDPKMRKVKAAPFRDRVVHHALCNLITPIFDQCFIRDSYACRKEKGVQNALKRLRKFLQAIHSEAREVYCLKCDIEKYFASIDHKILFLLLRKKIKDEKILALIKKIIDSSYDRIEQENLFETRKVGIPIGNLTSQLFANIYLNELDQFVKHQNFGKKTFSSQKYYLRYMDDFLFLGKDKKELCQIKKEIAIFLQKKLRLKFHPKKVSIFPIKNGIDFLGYRVYYPNPIKLRKGTVYRFLKRMKKYQKNGISLEERSHSAQSFLGFASHADSGGLIATLNIRDHLI